MTDYHKWNVIFLLDAKLPTKIVLMRRAANKDFAPNLYTGIGGKVEPGETILESAHRELQEESGITNVSLTEFARCIRDDTDTLYYFGGIYIHNALPRSTDGRLEWVPRDAILKKDLIPTTFLVCKEWRKRDFTVNRPFTLYIKTIGKKDTVALVSLKEIKENLL